MSTLIPYPSVPSFPGFTSYDLSLAYFGMSLRSPYTGKRQTINTAYAVWSFKGTYSKSLLANSGLLRSFLGKLAGQANKFNLPLPECSVPLSGYTGITGYVSGASQTGITLVTNGWTASTLILVEGDYFTINGELKLVTANCISDGSGNATISFTPALRASPANYLQLFVGNKINGLLYSEQFDNAAWTKTNTTITTNFTTNPLGGSTADKAAITGTGANSVAQTVAYSQIQNLPFTFSVYIKNSTLTGNIVLTAKDANGVTIGTSTITPTTSWVRYPVTVTPTTYGTNSITVTVAPADTTSGHLYYIWGAQLEQAGSQSIYKQVTTGDGVPYVCLNNNKDDAATWSLTPPILYDVSVDWMECIE